MIIKKLYNLTASVKSNLQSVGMYCCQILAGEILMKKNQCINVSHFVRLACLAAVTFDANST